MMRSLGEMVCRIKIYLIRKLGRIVQQERRGREKIIFVIAPNELLMTCLMFRFSSFREHIRSLEVLTEYSLFS